jgi:hypothetical protein
MESALGRFFVATTLAKRSAASNGFNQPFADVAFVEGDIARLNRDVC